MLASPDYHIDYSSGSIPECSPSLRFSNLSDPMFVTNACRPIISTQITTDEFIPEFITEELLPNIKLMVSKGVVGQLETVPTVMRLTLDNYPEIGYNILVTEVFPFMKEAIQEGCTNRSKEISDLFVEVVSMIPSYCRDEIVIEIVEDYSSDANYKTRMLAVYLIPIVRDSNSVLKCFQNLADDVHPNVRAAVVSQLKYVTFEERIVVSILKNATNDSSVIVLQTAASIFGDITPHLTAIYGRLLFDINTVKYAFPSFSKVISCSSIVDLIESFIEGSKLDQDNASKALLDSVQYARESESSYYARAALSVITYQPFIKYISHITNHFENKEEFLKLLDPKLNTKWRNRILQLEQVIHFLPEYSYQIMDIIEQYSDDDVAAVRNATVDLWKRLVDTQFSMRNEIEERLMRGKYVKRIIFAKLIGLCGVSTFPNGYKKLKEDPIELVRGAVENYIRE